MSGRDGGRFSLSVCLAQNGVSTHDPPSLPWITKGDSDSYGGSEVDLTQHVYSVQYRGAGGVCYCLQHQHVWRIRDWWGVNAPPCILNQDSYFRSLGHHVCAQRVRPNTPHSHQLCGPTHGDSKELQSQQGSSATKQTTSQPLHRLSAR